MVTLSPSFVKDAAAASWAGERLAVEVPSVSLIGPATSGSTVSLSSFSKVFVETFGSCLVTGSSTGFAGANQPAPTVLTAASRSTSMPVTGLVSSGLAPSKASLPSAVSVANLGASFSSASRSLASSMVETGSTDWEPVRRSTIVAGFRLNPVRPASVASTSMPRPALEGLRVSVFLPTASSTGSVASGFSLVSRSWRAASGDSEPTLTPWTEVFAGICDPAYAAAPPYSPQASSTEAPAMYQPRRDLRWRPRFTLSISSLSKTSVSLPSMARHGAVCQGADAQQSGQPPNESYRCTPIAGVNIRGSGQIVMRFPPDSQ